jgi:two-component system, NarL family, response regulator LiaR
MKQIKILIVDDHPIMREALAVALATEPDMLVVASSADGVEGVAQAAEYNPDVILMDLLMPGINGLEAITQILSHNPQARIMVVSSLENQEQILAAIQAGAIGFFPKTAPRSFLIEGIRKIADGIPYLPSGITLKLFQGIRELGSPGSEQSSAKKLLTTRQQEILVLLGEGRTDYQIGQTLHLSEATVRSHVHNILLRLGLENRSQVVAYANRQQDQGA